eukprot:s1783_g8.t1
MLFLQIVLAAVLLLCRAQIRVLSHFSVDTKAWSPFATIPQEFSCTLAKANQAVQDNFNAAEHLPDKVFPYLNGHLPAHVCNDHDVCSATQALSNGASIMLWSQQPSPLAMLAFHVANAQKRKSRLLQAAETLIEVADDTLESTQDSDEGAGQDGWGRSSHTVQAKSICLQSFTFTELFFRCSADYPQVETTDEKDNKDNTGLWQGQALHLDEAYEFLEGLALLGPREKAGHQDRDSICYSETAWLALALASLETTSLTCQLQRVENAPLNLPEGALGEVDMRLSPALDPKILPVRFLPPSPASEETADEVSLSLLGPVRTVEPEMVAKDISRHPALLERENALLRCGGPPNPLDKEIEDIMGKVDNFTEFGMAKLGAAPVAVGRGQPTLPKKTAEHFQRELTLPTLQGAAADMLPQSPAAESEQLDSLQRITLRKRSTLHDFSIMKVQTVNPTQPSAVKPWYVINPARCPMGGAWQILVCASLIFVALVTPVQVCLLQVRYNAAFFVSVLVDFIFFIDMMLQFCTAYTRNTPSGVVLEVRLNKIVARYVKTWFLLDFVTLIPFDVFAPTEPETTSGYSSVKVLRALRLLKLIRLARRSLWMEEQEAPSSDSSEIRVAANVVVNVPESSGFITDIESQNVHDLIPKPAAAKKSRMVEG